MADALRLTITVTPSLEDRAASFRRLADSGLYEGLGRLAQRSGRLLLAALQRHAPVSKGLDPRRKPGALKASIRQVQRAHYAGAITMEYRADGIAQYVIKGTRPHLIRPKRARVLAYYGSDGTLRFSASVQHPGTAPNDFPRRALREVAPAINSELRRLGRELWASAGR